MEQNTTKLRDIKPLLEIPDMSVYLYWTLMILAVMLLLAGVYLLYRKLQKSTELSLEKRALEVLNTLEWSSPKKAAYSATHYGRILAKDARREALFLALLPHLEKYKYKKEIEKVDDQTRESFELYKRICNESV